MAKHTKRKARHPPPSPRAPQRRSFSLDVYRNQDHAALFDLAERHGRALLNVAGDDECQFHALLHALNHQLEPPRATEHDAASLRAAIVDLLDDDALLERSWLDTDRPALAPIFNLRATLAAEAARGDRKWTLREWFAKMRSLREWGDGGTLIGAALLCRVRVHILTTVAPSGVLIIEAHQSFGDEFTPNGDIYLALIGDCHYMSTLPVAPSPPSSPATPPPERASPPPSPSSPTSIAPSGDTRIGGAPPEPATTFDDDMLDVDAWDARARRWRDAAQSWVEARGLDSTAELDVDHLLKLAHGALPSA